MVYKILSVSSVRASWLPQILIILHDIKGFVLSFKFDLGLANRKYQPVTRGRQQNEVRFLFPGSFCVLTSLLSEDVVNLRHLSPWS